MSERKDLFSTASSAKNTFPLPNSPSINHGGLEGRGNVSDSTEGQKGFQNELPKRQIVNPNRIIPEATQSGKTRSKDSKPSNPKGKEKETITGNSQNDKERSGSMLPPALRKILNQNAVTERSASLKKPKPPLQPTERDLLLLEKLHSYGTLSTQQIRELIFNGINTKTVLRRLRLLKQRGWIFSSEALANGGLAWVLSKKAARKFDISSDAKSINKSAGQHDVTVSAIRIQLERLGIVKGWVAEHILRQKELSLQSLNRLANRRISDSPLIPDSLIVVQKGPQMKSVALELELTLKSKERYKKLFSFYRRKEEIWFVWYVVLSRSMGERLRRMWRKETCWRAADCGFAYSTLEEIFKDGFTLPEPQGDGDEDK